MGSQYPFRACAAVREARSSCEPRFDVAEYLNQTNDVGIFEHTFDTIAVEIGERGLIKQLRVHYATRGEMP